jgi:hypothetical protein
MTFSDTTLLLSGTPTHANIGVHNLKLKVKDLFGASDSSSFTLTVGADHAPTIASHIPDKKAYVNQTFGLSIPLATATDVDQGDKITYNVKLADGSDLPAWLSFTASTRLLKGKPLISDTGKYEIAVIASDLSNLHAIDTFILKVQQFPDEILFANKAGLLNVYPNPAKDKISISWDQLGSEDVKLNIIDMSGKIIYMNIFRASNFNAPVNIDIKNIKSGIYIIELQSNKTKLSKTIQILK